MGAELFSEYAVYRRSIQYQDAILSRISDRPEWTIEQMLTVSPEDSRIQEPEYSQPMCTAVQIALTDLLRSWKVQPIATVGHSSGEIAAAYAAGVHTAAEAIVIAYHRGRAVSQSRREGLMLAVGLGADQVAPYTQGLNIAIAAVNSP